MRKLILIQNDKLPTGWVYDNKYSDTNGDDVLHLYRHIDKGVVIVQFDYTGGSEKISVNSGVNELKELKTHLITLNVRDANKMALTVMEN